MTPRKAPEAVLVALAEAVDIMDREFPGENTMAVDKTLAAYRSAVAPLRTRAEVDADVVATVRSAMQIPAGKLDVMKLNRLCSEPTADETEPCSVCNGRGYTDDCNCQYAHSCKVCPRGSEYERQAPLLNPNRTKL